APPPAAPVAPVPRGATVALSLREAVALTLANNLDIRIEALTPEIRAAEIRQEEGAFDPTLGARAEAAHDRTPRLAGADLDSRGREPRTLTGEVTLGQRLPLGTRYDLSYATERLSTRSTVLPNPAYSADVLLQVTQPLLRNFGADINRTAIVVARGNRDIAAANFRRQLLQSVFTTIQLYWTLVQNLDALDAARESLRLARQLLERNRVQVQVGTMAPIEVTQAEAGVAAREEAVIVAEAAVRDTEDRLKRALLVDADNVFDYTITPTDRPEFAPAEIELAPFLEAALRLRPELAAARTEVRNQEANLRLALNQRLPELNLVGSVGVAGLDDQPGGAHEDLGREAGEQYRWSLGLVFSYPLGNRTARAQVAAQELALRQRRTALRNLELQVAEEVRAAVRAVNTNIQRVRATREATRLARAQLEAEERRLAVGLSTSFEVLRLQADLATARNAEIRALADYRISLAALDRAVGTLLDRVGVLIKE
ncbi:MAG TPA: TolC family protein, partial [Thermodesulfobacteriota bacterium]|nr:TolC family protein [Thermodesulfobacteriota bacterium]